MLTLQRRPPHVLPRSARADIFDDTIGCGDPRALDRIGIETALRNHILPLESRGAVTPVAAASRARFRRLEPHLRALLGPVACTIRTPELIEASILNTRSAYLARRAERRAPLAESCRSWSGLRLAIGALIVLAGLVALAFIAPKLLIWGLFGWAVLTLIAVTVLRGGAALAEWLAKRRNARAWRSTRSHDIRPSLLPRVSLLVPLFQEKDIAARLVSRLSALDYPRDRLEICLILEAGDDTTEMALKAATLPDWMRIVRVPGGELRTKPRAMNYALDFTNGDIIGVYDAEDAPERDQLQKVASRFARAGPDVACLQGVLDFYNGSQSLLTRCFSIDYAIWFRLVLPGLERLGLVLPLGGTTIFFRRSALETMGRWDAHNVTEDADLGLRLARRGYRCAMVNSVTSEEATATIPAWLKQRSRWIKGYAMTWAVHMRDPGRLYSDLGLWRFMGVQILFLGTLSQFLLAPFLWSFWLVIFGVPHPLVEIAPWSAIVALGILFFFAEMVTLILAACAVARPKHRWLIKWVPLMHLYFPLAAIASWKGFAELVFRPFYWDKTVHGHRATRREGEPASEVVHGTAVAH